jgi:hypothetical protein
MFPGCVAAKDHGFLRLATAGVRHALPLPSMAPSRDEPNPNAHSNIAMQAIVFSDLSAAIFHELMNQVSSVDELFAYLHHIIEAKLQIDDGRMREVTDHMENCHEDIRTSLERLLQLSTITGSLPGAPRRQVEAAVYDSWKEAVSILGPLLWPGGTAVEWRGERNCFIRSPEGHITQKRGIRQRIGASEAYDRSRWTRN